MQFTRKFLNAREVDKDGRTKMNLHNNNVGRKVRILFIQMSNLNSNEIKFRLSQNYLKKTAFVMVFLEVVN
jgi:hypothetical protein